MKPLYLLFTLLLALGLAGCSPDAQPQSTAEPTAVVSEPNEPIAEPDPPTTEPTAEPTATTQVAEPEPEPELEEEEPTAVPMPTMTASPTPASSDPATFVLPETVAATAVLTTVQSTADDLLNNLPYWGIYPTHHIYTLDAYSLSDTFHTPQLIIFPMPDFAELNPAAREAYQQLQQILAEQPELATLERLPFLPIFNAAQTFHTQQAYLAFGNGQGIRYLTQFDQALNPITNRTLFYTFQGLTNDGRHYVTAVLPIAHPTLPDAVAFDASFFAPDSYDQLTADFDDYLQEIVATLEESDPASFTPSLTDLDAFIGSVQINLPAPPKRTNDSGQIILTIDRPVAHAQLAIGTEQTVSGYVAPGSTDEVTLSLLSGTNSLWTTTVTPDSTTGNWSAILPVPAVVQGQGQLVAQMGTQQDSRPVTLYQPFQPEGDDPTAVVIGLLRPIIGSSLTIGMPVFFEGRVQNPIDNSLTIAVLGENCTTFYARQNITLPAGGGQWTGTLFLPAEQIPPDETGCVIAYTGSYGEDWREVQLRMPLRSPDDERANQLTVGLPFDARATAGEPVTIFGGAVNAPEGLVAIRVATSGMETRLLGEVTTAVDDFGYWEAEIELPEDYQGFATVTVTMPGLNSDALFYSTGLSIE